MRMADRVDPLAGVPCPVEPVGLSRRDLDHALHRADGESCGAGGEELPQVPARLGHAHETCMEDGQEHVRGEAPVAEAHDAGSDPDRHLVPLAHARLCGLVVPAVRNEAPDRDSVADERDVEDEQADGGEPERALSQSLAGERPPDHAWQHVPAEPGRDQCAAADDHHVRVREVADEMSGVAGACEPLGGPGQVLHDHVEAAENEEAAAGDEVLRQLRIVSTELLVAVRHRSHRQRLSGQQAPESRDDDREEADVRQELERREVLQVHGCNRRASTTVGRVR